MNDFWNNTPRSLLLVPAIIGASIILSTIIASTVFYKVRSFDNVLSVTGSTKVSVRSDQARWVARFNRTVYASSLKTGYADMAADLRAVKEFYAKRGIAEADLVISPVFMDEMYSYKENGFSEKQYNLRQTVEMQSSDVEKVTALANDVSAPINNGVLFSTQSLEYYYSKLPDLRVSLLSGALKDAKARASEIAASGGNKVGALRAASSGVVQVLPHNSIEVMDYGAYDTSAIEKDVMVTVKASFSVK